MGVVPPPLGLTLRVAPMLTFFVHVPKTGGLTLQRWLEQVYDPDSLLVWNPSARWNLRRQLPELATLLGQRPGVEAVAGHFPYGAHAVLGDRPYRYVTFLRDPVDRWISERVHHLTKNADAVLLGRPFSEIYADTDLFALLRSALENDDDLNLQSRFLGHGLTRGPIGPLPGRAASETGALSRFWFVGRQESLAADCGRLARLLGREAPPLAESLNVAGHGDVRAALTADEIRWIEGRNASDIALCDRVAISGDPLPRPPVLDRHAVVTAILQAALRRMGECFVALYADRLDAQRLLEYYSALAASRAA